MQMQTFCKLKYRLCNNTCRLSLLFIWMLKMARRFVPAVPALAEWFKRRSRALSIQCYKTKLLPPRWSLNFSHQLQQKTSDKSVGSFCATWFLMFPRIKIVSRNFFFFFCCIIEKLMQNLLSTDITVFYTWSLTKISIINKLNKHLKHSFQFIHELYRLYRLCVWICAFLH